LETAVCHTRLGRFKRYLAQLDRERADAGGAGRAGSTGQLVLLAACGIESASGRGAARVAGAGERTAVNAPDLLDFFGLQGAGDNHGRAKAEWRLQFMAGFFFQAE